MKNIIINAVVAQSEKSLETLNGLALYRSFSYKKEGLVSKLNTIRDKEKNEGQTFETQKIREDLERKISEIDKELNSPELKIFQSSYDELFTVQNVGTPDWNTVSVFANFHSQTHYTHNVENLYKKLCDCENNEASKKELKRHLDAILHTLRKPCAYLKGIKVNANMTEIEIFYRMILKGFKADKKAGSVKSSMISYKDFKKQFALYIISLYAREELTIIETLSETDISEMATAEQESGITKQASQKVETKISALEGRINKAPKKEEKKDAETIPSVDTSTPKRVSKKTIAK